MNYFDVDKISLGVDETPLQYLENVSADLGIDLYIKRDDLNGLGFGGNKIRKLEYLVKDAMDKGATRLLTVGGTQTNNGRLTAAVASKMGLKSGIVMVGNKPEVYSGNMLLDLILDADLYYVDDSLFKGEHNYSQSLSKAIAEKVDEVTLDLESKGEKVYFIPMGGSNELGALGYVNGAGEINKQCHEREITIDYIVTAYGSVGTYAGLLLGAKFYNMNAKVLGMNVIHDFENDNSILEKHLAYANSINDMYELESEITLKDFNIRTDTIGEGYNIHDSLTRDAVMYLARKEAIFLDFSYTGKAFRGLIDSVNDGSIKKGSTVVFIHTGGAPGIFSNEHSAALNQYFNAR